MRRLLFFSLFLNSILAGTIGFMTLRMGGLKQLFTQYWYAESGLYDQRKGHFNALDTLSQPIVMLGDNHIAQCEWSELLGQPLGHQVINRGIMGDQTEGVRQRIEEVTRHQPSKIFICVGTNDLLLNKDMRSVELSYRELIRQLRNTKKNRQIYLVSVPPVNNEVKKVGITNAQIAELNNRIEQIGRDNSVQYLNLHPLLSDGNGNLAVRFTTDGLHLNAAGYKKWHGLLMGYLR
jgi:lysophospholipase L1-like esterase